MGNLLRAMAAEYNSKTSPDWKDQAAIPPVDATVFLECKIVDFLANSYGKYANNDTDIQILMEYNQLFPYVIPKLPWTLSSNSKFVKWI